jgi:hypothetical protein
MKVVLVDLLGESTKIARISINSIPWHGEALKGRLEDLPIELHEHCAQDIQILPQG